MIRMTVLVGVCAFALVGCSGDDDSGGSGGAGGSGATGATGGSSGSSGSAGAGGAGAAAGSGGVGASAGAAGSAGNAGSAGSGPVAMSFFVSSTPVSKTGNLGGLAGADAHCQKLAQVVGSTKTKWVAYLSVEDGGNGSPVHAKERIGAGPWYNQKLEVFSPNLTALHPTIDPAVDRPGYIKVKPADALFMDETGANVPGPQHDILTGTAADGTVKTGATCDDWTSAAGNRIGQVGHSDTPSSTNFSPSWNSAHESQSCSESGLIARGGNGRIYCFAAD
jgi:hypothetical protein